MKTTTQLCLGVAVAGALTGAGAAVGCAVAAADAAPDSVASTASAPKHAGPVSRRVRPSAATTGTSRTAVSTRPAAARPAATRPMARVPAPGSSLPVLGSASAAAVLPADYAPTHVLLIGTDGTNLSKILADPQFATGGFAEVMSQGVTGATTLVGHTTISGPSWSTILTGAWDNKTGVFNNIFNPRPYRSWPTAFNLIEYYRPEVDTAVIADWKYINDMAAAGGYPVDPDGNTYVPFDTDWATTDGQVVADTIALINSTVAGSSSFVFSYQVQVDEIGHAFGGGSPQYAQAVQNVSENIDDIMAAIGAWEDTNGETWTVIVTTDHGHQQSKGFGHGFQSPNETSSFVIYRDGDPATPGNLQNLGYSNTDITPTIVNLFGIPARTDFDGAPLGSKTASVVDPVNLVVALQNAIAANGYPNIGTDLALGVRTVFGAVPYFLNGFVEAVTGLLQNVVNQNIFLISQLAGITEAVVGFTGDVLVGATQAVAAVVAHLTGAGTIPPSDEPLPLPPAASLPAGLSAAALV